jgi:hypothetical protein
MATANTILSDINEIQTGYFLNGEKWYDTDAKAQFEQRSKQATPEEVKDAIAKAKVMAKEFTVWAKNNGYRLPIKQIWWTARPNSMSSAVGYPVDQKKNPTDILVKFSSGPSDGFLGLSAKATQGKGEIGFKNPGLGTIDRNLGLHLSEEYNNQVKQAVKKYSLPETATTRKTYIRANPGVKKQTEEIGVSILAAMRDELMVRLQKMKQPQLMQYLLTDWMDADIMKPPYIKVTGQGNKEPYRAIVMDPTANDKLSALGKYAITLENVGNESIGVKAGEKKIMKIRFKFESEKIASSVKLSGEPW